MEIFQIIRIRLSRLLLQGTFGEAARLGVRFNRLQQLVVPGGGRSGSAWQGIASDRPEGEQPGH